MKLYAKERHIAGAQPLMIEQNFAPPTSSPPAACDLGGLQYTAQWSTGAVLTCLQALTELWPKLARSPSTLQRKRQRLRVVAWPRALHVSSTVYIAYAHLERQGRCNECTRTCQDGNTTAVASLGWPYLRSPTQSFTSCGTLCHRFEDMS